MMEELNLIPDSDSTLMQQFKRIPDKYIEGYIGKYILIINKYKKLGCGIITGADTYKYIKCETHQPCSGKYVFTANCTYYIINDDELAGLLI